MIRTSTLIGVFPPSRSITLSCSTRSSLTCASRVSSPISSRKIVDPSASFEAADLLRQRAGVSAALAAKQLALDERGRNRAAVDAHHRPLMALAHLVNGLCEHFLAAAGFAEQQHGRGRISDRFDLGERALGGSAFGHDGRHPQRVDLASQNRVLERELVALPSQGRRLPTSRIEATTTRRPSDGARQTNFDGHDAPSLHAVQLAPAPKAVRRCCHRN